jgi:hypothetical protein
MMPKKTSAGTNEVLRLGAMRLPPPLGPTQELPGARSLESGGAGGGGGGRWRGVVGSGHGVWRMAHLAPHVACRMALDIPS